MLTLVFGRREQGKTTLGYKLAHDRPRRLIFDPRGMIGDSRDVTLAELRGSCDLLHSGAVSEVIYTPRDDSRLAFPGFAAEIQNWIEVFPDQSLAVMVDEATLAEPQRAEAFMWAIRCCRRQVVDIIVTAHRPKDVHTDIRALSDNWCIFAVRQEHDLAVVEERCTVDVVAQVQRLEPRQFIHWDDAKGVAERYPVPSAWYIPLQREFPLGGPAFEMPERTLRGGQPVARIDTGKLF